MIPVMTSHVTGFVTSHVTVFANLCLMLVFQCGRENVRESSDDAKRGVYTSSAGSAVSCLLFLQFDLVWPEGLTDTSAGMWGLC